MAIVHFEVKSSKDRNTYADCHFEYIDRQGKYASIKKKENNRGLLAGSHYQYIEREEDYSKGDRYEDFVVGESHNMPSWAENPADFWRASQIFERANGKTYTEFLLSLPHELSIEENIQLVKEFCRDTFGESFVYSFGIHDKKSTIDGIQNTHVHIMFCERKLDGIERGPELFFKRANPKYPDRGGAKKDRYWNNIKMPKQIRISWTNMLNKELEKKGIELVSAETLKIQKEGALLENDGAKANFFDRPPINLNSTTYMQFQKKGYNSLEENQKWAVNQFLEAKMIRDTKKEEYQKIQKIEQEKEIETFLNNLAKQEFILKELSKKKDMLEDPMEFKKYLYDYATGGKQTWNQYMLEKEEKFLQESIIKDQMSLWKNYEMYAGISPARKYLKEKTEQEIKILESQLKNIEIPDKLLLKQEMVEQVYHNVVLQTEEKIHVLEEQKKKIIENLPNYFSPDSEYQKLIFQRKNLQEAKRKEEKEKEEILKQKQEKTSFFKNLELERILYKTEKKIKILTDKEKGICEKLNKEILKRIPEKDLFNNKERLYYNLDNIYKIETEIRMENSKLQILDQVKQKAATINIEVSKKRERKVEKEKSKYFNSSTEYSKFFSFVQVETEKIQLQEEIEKIQKILQNDLDNIIEKITNGLSLKQKIAKKEAIKKSYQRKLEEKQKELAQKISEYTLENIYQFSSKKQHEFVATLLQDTLHSKKEISIKLAILSKNIDSKEKQKEKQALYKEHRFLSIRETFLRDTFKIIIEDVQKNQKPRIFESVIADKKKNEKENSKDSSPIFSTYIPKITEDSIHRNLNLNLEKEEIDLGTTKLHKKRKKKRDNDYEL